MSAHTATQARTARTFIAAADADTSETPDIRVSETVTTRYGEKYVLTGVAGDTYDILSSKGEDLSGEMDWDTAHCTFDKGVGEWVCDAEDDALAHVVDVLTANGYTVDTDAAEDDGDDEGLLSRVVGFAAPGDEIRVRYAMKNGNGVNDRAGEVTRVFPEDDTLLFRDGDDKTKRVREGDYGDPALFSNGRYPFMGEVLSVTVIPADDGEDGDEDEDEGEGDDLREEVAEKVEAAACLHNNDGVDISFNEALQVAGYDPEAIREALAEGRIEVDEDVSVPA